MGTYFTEIHTFFFKIKWNNHDKLTKDIYITSYNSISFQFNHRVSVYNSVKLSGFNTRIDARFYGYKKKHLFQIFSKIPTYLSKYFRFHVIFSSFIKNKTPRDVPV